MPKLRLLFLALCLCLAPCTPRADGLFIFDSGKSDDEGHSRLQIIPVTNLDHKVSPVYAQAMGIYRKKDSQGAEALREQALNGDMDALLALAALSRLAEEEKRPPLFGAPAAFWRDWVVRMLGEKEAWFRIGAALYECSPEEALFLPPLTKLTSAALHRAADAGHPEAMLALAFLDSVETFHMPDDPGFPIAAPLESDPDDQKEAVMRNYWLSAAAAHGSARAICRLGYRYLADTSFRDEHKARELLVKSMRLGSFSAAQALYVFHYPFSEIVFSGYATCRTHVYYGMIRAKMLKSRVHDEALADRVKLMLEGNNDLFPKACLTRKEYEDATREAEQEFKRIKAGMLARKEAHDALYARAQPMFAEMRDAFAAQAKEKSAPAGPCTPCATALFTHDDGMLPIGEINTLRIIPDQEVSPAYAQGAAELFLGNDAREAAALREHALNGDMDALIALAALSRLAEKESRPPLFGAPAAFWEDWVVRMLGGKEAWFRIGAALFECGKADGLPQTTLEQMATDALRKAAKLGHPEAMYALAYLSVPYPDRTFQLPKAPGFPIFPSPADSPDTPDEFRYWMSAAAFHGSARANYISGCVYLDPDPKLYDEKKCFEMFSKSMRLGLVPAANILYKVCTPQETHHLPKYASCKSHIYYSTLWAKMFDEPKMLRLINDTARAMMEGNNHFYPEACLTRKEYEDAIREAGQEFKRIKADMLARKEAHDALYAKAKPMFAEMRNAFAEQAKR